MVEAKLNREYAVRVLGVGALMVGICVWSVYDGCAGYPRQNRLLEQVRPALLATNLTAEAWLAREDGEAGRSRLDEAFAEMGGKAPAKLSLKLSELKVPDTAPDRDTARAAQMARVRKTLEEPVYSAKDLNSQLGMAAITLTLGLWAFVGVALKARRRFRADESGLSGSGIGGPPVAYGDIQSADWAKWDEKGIVKLALKTGGRLTLDGWHFTGVTGLVDELVKHRPDLGPEVAVNARDAGLDGGAD
jgi:hypothetical protein